MAHDSKTEKPTPRRRQKAREQGQVARSRDLAAALSALAALLMISVQIPSFALEWRQLFSRTLSQSISGDLPLDRTLAGLSHASFFPRVAATLAVSWLVATSVSVAQGGMVFASSAIAPSLARISPTAKLEQLFSLAAAKGLMKSILPAAAVVYLAYSTVVRDFESLLALNRQNISGIMAFTLAHVFEIGWKSGVLLLLWAGIDYLFEHHRLETDLRMSRQDLVDEYKELEGNPTIKARIRRLQRRVQRRRQLEDVKRASIVITNPTEFAVALEYKLEMGAPIVVAKGRNHLAAEIKQIARWHEIPVLENPPLAHALYRAVEIGQVIPPKLYTVVAEILAAVYRAQAEASRRRSGAAQ